MTAAGLLAGFLVKYQCVIHPWADFFQYRRLCYSDIQALWSARGIKDGLVPYRDVQLEYPVLTGMFMDLSGRLLRVLGKAGIAQPSHSSYFVISAFLLAPFAFLVTALLRPFVPARRLVIWAAGTPLVLYGFMNWDLPAAAAATWCITAFLRKRYGSSGAAAAVGASAKLYPLFFLPALALALFSSKQIKPAGRLLAAFLGTAALINVPWILASNGAPHRLAGVSPEVQLRTAGANGWLGIWLFHARRGAEFDTVWFWLGQHGRPFTSLRSEPFISTGTLALFALLCALVLWSAWRRQASRGGFLVIQVCLGILCAFLVTSKVYSPQYGLWIAPLLALVEVPWPGVFCFLAADLVVFVSRFFFYTTGPNVSSGWAAGFQAGVWVRAAVLAVLFWWTVRQEGGEPEGPPGPKEFRGGLIVSRP